MEVSRRAVWVREEVKATGAVFGVIQWCLWVARPALRSFFRVLMAFPSNSHSFAYQILVFLCPFPPSNAQKPFSSDTSDEGPTSEHSRYSFLIEQNVRTEVARKPTLTFLDHIGLSEDKTDKQNLTT